jgi:CheY-like chemotaxis protein
MSSPVILLAEDDEIIHRLFVNFLEGRGCHVDSAYDGREAIAALGRRLYDCVVLDMMMPIVDGTAVLAFMLESAPDVLAKTIIISAYPELASEMHRKRVCAVMQKPFEMDDFGAMLDICLAAKA